MKDRYVWKPKSDSLIFLDATDECSTDLSMGVYQSYHDRKSCFLVTYIFDKALNIEPFSEFWK